jgi:hypothetical protein
MIIEPFMRNPCMHPYCKDSNCSKCFFYKPMLFNIRVPRFVGNFLFKLQDKLMEVNHEFGKKL